MSVPIPERKPIQSNNQNIINSVTGTVSDGIGEIWDFGKSVFNRVIDYKYQIWEAEQISRLRQAEAAGDVQRQEDLYTGAGYVKTPQGQGGSVSSLATIGVLGIAAILLSRG